MVSFLTLFFHDGPFLFSIIHLFFSYDIFSQMASFNNFLNLNRWLFLIRTPFSSYHVYTTSVFTWPLFFLSTTSIKHLYTHVLFFFFFHKYSFLSVFLTQPPYSILLTTKPHQIILGVGQLICPNLHTAFRFSLIIHGHHNTSPTQPLPFPLNLIS